ncbi:MAG: ArgE/DapE family deacylase [Chloroflexi bacterium]|nr:ArgE/DapE family deacylase [Chloroflexota bacterium]MCY3582654.1 ArgE/DapE family deacylase [Chloroflexota bacterium]MCY3717769.1 ArgE/DapE family deacylase [Chloroflexota bacterium]MDE2651478.1 ArgE/DapE family deacylase [Chloroflexota bacterium]MXV92883.1 ArgE/DapE family deacylase [Chloroflexota bacterium]
MNELHTLISDLVAIDSVNPDLVPGGAGEAQIADYIANWGRARQLDVIVQPTVSGRPNVILRAPGSGGGKSLMLNAHTDTVGVAGMDAPFSSQIRGGRLYGRGAYDMKSGLAACMLTLLAAQSMQLRGDVLLSAVADEEYGSIGTEALLADWARWQADAVLIAEPTALDIGIAHRGFVWLEFETQGTAAHGSLPEQGVDAIAKMGKVLVELAALDEKMRAEPTHELLGSGSLHASMIQGGEEISMYPALCKLLVERRTIPGEDAARVLAQAQHILDGIAAADSQFRASVQAIFSRPPYAIDAAHPLARQLQTVAAARLKRKPALIGCPWWMDSALFAAAGLPTVVLGPAGAGAHAREEWVELESVAACQAIYTQFAAAFCA